MLILVAVAKAVAGMVIVAAHHHVVVAAVVAAINAIAVAVAQPQREKRSPIPQQPNSLLLKW